MLLEDKTIVLTGCNRGIGLSTLRLLAINGASVWACVRKPDNQFLRAVDEITLETGSKITPVYFDLSDFREVKVGAKKILADKLAIDVLINNAGSIFTGPAVLTSIDKVTEMFNINFASQMLFTQYLMRNMMKNRSGCIVNVSSSAAIEGNEGRLAYAASKAAIISATKVLSRELGQYNIRVNAIAPGLTDTDMMTSSTDPDVLVETLKQVGLGRVASPEEIAKVILFLASDLSSYVTGQVIRVDGGM